MTGLPAAASRVRRSVLTPAAVTVNPGNRIDVAPARVGRLLVKVTVTVWPWVTINVGPGSCIVGQFPPAMVVGRKVPAAAGVVQPYPHEYTVDPSGSVI